MIIESESVRVGVDVDSGEDEVGDGDAGLGEQGQDGDGLPCPVVVSLIVGDEAGEVLLCGGRWTRRQGWCVLWRPRGQSGRHFGSDE